MKAIWKTVQPWFEVKEERRDFIEGGRREIHENGAFAEGNFGIVIQQ